MCAPRNAPPGPRPSRVSGCSALVLDPNDKLGPAARTASGNLAPKPMLFFPADPRAITLWRFAAAFNAGDAATAAALVRRRRASCRWTRRSPGKARPTSKPG